MNKIILGLMVVPLVLSGCIKKAEEKPTEKTEKTSTIKATEQPPKEENIIPAIFIRLLVMVSRCRLKKRKRLS